MNSSRDSSGLSFSEPDELSQLKNYFISLLSRREYSRSELRQKALRKFAQNILIEETLDEMQRLGCQSDIRFTEAFIRSKRVAGQGPHKIEQLLKRKGITGECELDVLDVENDDWNDDCFIVWKKKFGVWEADHKAQQKQLKFLVYRGFSFGQASKALEKAHELYSCKRRRLGSS